MARSELSTWWRCARLAFAVALAFAALLAAGKAQAQHFDVELRTDKGPVAGSRITTGFYGDTQSVGVSVDAVTGHQIFPAYLGDFAGGPYATANPGFQAFNGTFSAGEVIHFRALGTLLHWTPATNTWAPAPAGVTVTLYGQIPSEVVIGYTANPSLWAEQYAYYKGGTRYDGQGITGPLTAAIDDVNAAGAFHSHLDWKITAASGTPPAGAYMLTLELWSPTLVNGQPKYLASQPFHVIFERGLTAAQMQAAFASRISPPCGARSMNWTVEANSCSASVPSTASGTAAVATDNVDPATGSATFACNKGSWGAAANASCSVPPPPTCSAQVMSWNVGSSSCTASVPQTESGSPALATDASGPTTGSARFVCTHGSWGAAENAACTTAVPRACGAQTLSWRVGDASCSAESPGIDSGRSVVATDTAAPAVGQATFSCDDGSWSLPSSAQCAVATPAACAARSLSWIVDGARCEALVAGTSSGSAASAIDATGPTTGSATFSCSNGAWSDAANASCTTPPLACPAQLLGWAVGANSCATTVPESPSGTSLMAIDDDGPASGTASFSCTNGLWSAPVAAACSVSKPIPAARTPAPPWAPPPQLPWDRPRR